MNYIKHQITENNWEYTAFENEGPEQCMALIVDISDIGNHWVRRGVYFGQHADEVQIDNHEFLEALNTALFSFYKRVNLTVYDDCEHQCMEMDALFCRDCGDITAHASHRE